MASNKGPLLLGLAALGGLAFMFTRKKDGQSTDPRMKGGVVDPTMHPTSGGGGSPVVNDLYHDLSQNTTGPSTTPINQDPLPSPVQSGPSSVATANGGQPAYPPPNWGVPNQRGGTTTGPDTDPGIVHD